MPRITEFQPDITEFGGDEPPRPKRRRRVGRHVSSPADLSRRHIPVTIVAQDPSVPGDGDCPLMATIDVPAEPLLPGPRGQRFFVVDFNAGTGEVGGPYVLTTGGAEGDGRAERGWVLQDVLTSPSRAAIVDDRRFHAQNVYATCAALLAQFESVLGRRIPWRFDGHQLYLVPHAFEGGNAGYSPDDQGILFGYLPAGPGQDAVYTCLSHDIIAHELTHAILDGLRPRYIEPGLPDQLAFHEGFADTVALLSVFGLADVVERALLLGLPPGRRARPAGGEPPLIPDAAFTVENLMRNALFRVGEQLGQRLEPGTGALRAPLADVVAGSAWRQEAGYDEPHRRGEVIVTAVCRTVAVLWADRLQEIRRHGKVPLRRAAEEGAKVAGHILGMCIRSLDYLPPIDFDFGDFIDAILAADEVVAPDDPHHYRDTIEATFAAYDIRPPARRRLSAGQLSHPWRHQGVNLRALGTSTDEVFRFIWQNADNLDIDLDLHLRVNRVLSVTRTGPDGLVVEEIIADYTQIVSAALGDLPPTVRRGVRDGRGEPVPKDTEAQIWGGGVIVFDQYGVPRHHVTKSILRTPDDQRRQQRRLAYLAATGVFDTKERLGFSTGRSDSASFRLLHDSELLSTERW